MVIFHWYVSSPEGNYHYTAVSKTYIIPPISTSIWRPSHVNKLLQWRPSPPAAWLRCRTAVSATCRAWDSHMRSMVLEYESQHLPHKYMTQSSRFLYTSTMEHMGFVKKNAFQHVQRNSLQLIAIAKIALCRVHCNLHPASITIQFYSIASYIGGTSPGTLTAFQRKCRGFLGNPP